VSAPREPFRKYLFSAYAIFGRSGVSVPLYIDNVVQAKQNMLRGKVLDPIPFLGQGRVEKQVASEAKENQRATWISNGKTPVVSLMRPPILKDLDSGKVNRIVANEAKVSHGYVHKAQQLN
jgi:hypothetical protein